MTQSKPLKSGKDVRKQKSKKGIVFRRETILRDVLKESFDRFFPLKTVREGEQKLLDRLM